MNTIPTEIVNDCLYENINEHTIKSHINNNEKKNTIIKKYDGGIFITMKIINAKRKKIISVRTSGNLSLCLDARIVKLYSILS